MARIALGIEYDGHAFYGWQAQTTLSTVQGHLQVALTKVANHPVELVCAGRTDAGVHAAGQVVHFDSDAERPLRAWVLGANANLPSTISVRWVQVVDADFHARFSAMARRYRYVIYNHPVRCALWATRTTWYQRQLDVEAMRLGAACLLGEQDFSSFRSSQCESRTPMRNVHEITIQRHQHYVSIEIQANAFLHHMVRNVVGVLMRVGAGYESPAIVQKILLARDRRVAFATAPATGLYLIRVDYPTVYQFPQPDDFPLFLQS